MLRFLKSFSSHYPKEFYSTIDSIENYGNMIIQAYHPINVGVTAYVLSLLEDYMWRTEDTKSIFDVLKDYAKQENYENYLQPLS